MPIVKKYKVNLAYFTTVRPLDNKLISKVNSISKNIIIIEPFYTGSVISEIIKILKTDVKLSNISVPTKFLTNYGLKPEHDKKLGFSMEFYQIK